MAWKSVWNMPKIRKAILVATLGLLIVFGTEVTVMPSQAQAVTCTTPDADTNIIMTWIRQLLDYVQRGMGIAAAHADALIAQYLSSGQSNMLYNGQIITMYGNKKIAEGVGTSINTQIHSSANTQLNAELAVKATMQPGNNAAEIAQAFKSRNAALDAVKGAIIQFAYLGMIKGTGGGADETAPAAAGEEYCSLIGSNWSFIDWNRYADGNGSSLVTNLKCGGKAPPQGPNPYAGADTSIGSVLDPLQYPLPKTAPTATKDNHLMFTNISSVGDGSTFYNDPVRFIAAFKYCDSLRGLVPSPPTGTKNYVPQDKDLQEWLRDRRRSARAQDIYQECITNLAYRTACPANTLSSKSGSGSDCHTLQVAMCNALHTPTSSDITSTNSGMNIDAVGNPEADNAIANCSTNGLSVAMFDMIEANKCASTGHVANLGGGTNGDSAAADERQSRCGSESRNFQTMLDARSQGLKEEVNGLYANFNTTNFPSH